MVTNGMLLRLVRDSGRLVKLTYIEFDLKRLLDEDKYSEFTLLYRLLHASRFPKTKQETEESLLEKYYQDSIESGNRIRNGLSSAVKESLIALGNGLLEHPENEELTERVLSGRPDPRDFYHQLLRLIYRLLFLMVTEERDLIFAEIRDENQEPDLDDLLNGIKRPTKKQKEIYYHYYSLIRLRKLSEKRYLQENQYTDLWQGLLQTFALFESGGTGNKLGILALGSELFSGNAMPDITSSKLNNKVLLQCIRSLNEFEDAKHNLSFINYRALDVEELGSVYEGLLELEPVFEWENEKPKFSFRKGSERSSSGSHYTPEDLVKPLIQHSLEYLIEERTSDFYKEKTTVAETKKKLLDLKVCDVACGSGHILLSAARRIAIEVARVETGEQQPNPTSFRHALKEVIRNCIYGVDKNPLAVELCKVALWLESHNPGEPLSFLDHRIKCGDAIVGLAHREELQNGIANEAYKKLPGDDKEIVSAFAKKTKQERTLREKSRQAVQLTTETDHKLMQQVRELNIAIDKFSRLPESTPDEIEQKENAYRKLINNESLKRLKILADLQVMPFFLEKTEGVKDYLITDAQYHRYLRGELQTPFNIEVKAIETSTINRFFHWFLEFPEVFQKGGFDCVLGNPPYLGGKKISGNFGDQYLNTIHYLFEGIRGQSDLITYFLRRIFSLINVRGILSIITTNSICEGDTREGGLAIITQKKGIINQAIRSVKWPGVANLSVSILTVCKDRHTDKYLNYRKVEHINAFFDTESISPIPFKILKNRNLYRGVDFGGTGFIITEKERKNIIDKNAEYLKVIMPLLNGEDITNNAVREPSRYIINFFDFEESEAKQFPEAFQIIEERVKPERMKKRDESAKKRWWVYKRNKVDLYKQLSNMEFCWVSPFTSKFLIYEKTSPSYVISNALNILVSNEYADFSILSSSLHDVWARKYCSTLETRLRYTPSDGYETFPFPKIKESKLQDELYKVGKEFYQIRNQILLKFDMGLTELLNLLHAQSDILTNKKYAGRTDLIELKESLIKLRNSLIGVDSTVLHAYQWNNIELHHNYYELDNLPENDRIRFTIHPDARKEILKRLLELNHKIHEEEVKAGLWDMKSGNKRTTKSKTKTNQVNEGEAGYGGLFG
ncbi:MAG: type IIL restriction-modification enzyme MmeI [Bacteroidales bacterium]